MFTRATVPIDSLLTDYESALTGMGYSFSTKLTYLKYVSLIIQRHQNNGLEYLDPEIFLNYVQEVDEKFLAVGLEKHYYGSVRRTVEKFVTYICPGKAGALPSPLKGARQKLSPTCSETCSAGSVHNI